MKIETTNNRLTELMKQENENKDVNIIAVIIAVATVIILGLTYVAVFLTAFGQ